MPFDSFTSTHPPVDVELVDRIVSKLKSQGIFDQFRKDCLADVDTKPAYQNLHQRVNVTVASFLATQKWQPDLNKTQLRESLRRHVQQGFLEVGVDRIVDQVVNPKIVPLFMPKVEDVVYDCLGIEKPKLPPSARLSTQFLTSFPPPLPRPCTPPKAEITDLLPKDLDPVSPESDSVCLNGSNTPLKDEINNTNTSTKFEDDQDSQLSGISELSSHMGDSFRENPEPVDSNTVRSISSPKSDSKDFQFDNFTNLSEKIKQAEKSHGQVSGIQSDKVENDVSDKSLNDISLPEELTGSSPKENREEIVSEDTKIESMSNNSLSNFEDSKTFTSSKLFKGDTILTLSDESLSSNTISGLKEENSISKTFQNSENSNGPLIIEQIGNLVPKNSQQPEKPLPKDVDQNDFSLPKVIEHSDNVLPKVTDQSAYIKEHMNDRNGPESLDEQREDKFDEINSIKKNKEKPKEKKSHDSSTSSRYSKSSDRHKHSDSKQRSHDKKLKSSERDHSLNREDKEDKSRRDDKNRSSHRDDKQKSLQKPDKDIISQKNEKESFSNKETSKKELKDKTHSRDKEKWSVKDESHKSQRDDKKKSNDEKQKNCDKDKKNEKIKDNEKEPRKESKNESKDSIEKEKKGSNTSNKEKELNYKNKEINDKEKEDILRSKRDSDKNRHDKSDKDKESKNSEKDEKSKSDRDRESKNNEKDGDKYLKEKNRANKDKHDKDRNGKQSREKSSSKDDKSRESKKSNYDKFGNSTSGKKTDNAKVDDLEKKSKVDDSSRNKSNAEKNKVDDKKERKRRGERCNDEVKTKDARRSSDRDSNGSKGGSSHRANLEIKSSSSNNSKHSSSEKKSRGSSSNGTHASQDQTDNISLSLEDDINEGKEEKLNYQSNIPMQHSLNDSLRGPSEVDLILSKLNSSIKEIENAHCNSMSETPIKKPKIAKNFAEMRKIMLVRKNMERKFKNEVNAHKDLNDFANNKTDESPSCAENKTKISEENKENFKSPGFEKSNTNLLKNNNIKTKEFHGFSDKDIEKVLNHFLRFEEIFGSVKYKRLFDFTENIVSHYKHLTVENCEELLDNNLNKLVSKTNTFSEGSIADSKLIERAVSGGNRCYVLLQQDCPEVTKHLKKDKWKEEESPQLLPAQDRLKGKGHKRRSRTRAGGVKAIRAYDEVRMEGSIIPANDEPSEAGPIGEAFTPDELHGQQANIGQQLELNESVSNEYDVNLRKLKLSSPESPNSEVLFPGSPDSISDEEGGLSVSLTEDMLNNLMKESMGELSGLNDHGDPCDSECEELVESSEIALNPDIVKENYNADVRENLSPHLNKNCNSHNPKQAKNEDDSEKKSIKRQPRSSQRYGSNDLYKPRPIFNTNSKRNRSAICGTPENDLVRPKRDQSAPPIKKTAR